MPEPNPGTRQDLLPLLCSFAMDLEISGPQAASLERLPGLSEAGVPYGVDEAAVKRALKAIKGSEVARRMAQVTPGRPEMRFMGGVLSAHFSLVYIRGIRLP